MAEEDVCKQEDTLIAMPFNYHRRPKTCINIEFERI
jgi:hypothetical protein